MIEHQKMRTKIRPSFKQFELKFDPRDRVYVFQKKQIGNSLVSANLQGIFSLNLNVLQHILNNIQNMTSGISPFIEKLQQILNDPENEEIISFNQTVGRLEIANKKKLEIILPKYFRHGRFESFVRQLNWYGFYKINNKTINCYSHPDLEKGNKLSSIKSRRKNLNPKQMDGKSPQQIQAFPERQAQINEVQNKPVGFFIPIESQVQNTGYGLQTPYMMSDQTQLLWQLNGNMFYPIYYSF